MPIEVLVQVLPLTANPSIPALRLAFPSMPKSAPRSARQPVATKRAPVAAPTAANSDAVSEPPTASPSGSIVPALDPSAMGRVIDILGTLQRGDKCTGSSFAKQFGVSTMTVSRTLALMRDRLGVDWEWDAVRATYFLKTPCTTLPLLRIEPREAIALALAAREFEKAYGPAFGGVLSSLLKKVAPLFGGEVTFAADAVDHIIPRPAAAVHRELDHFFPLFDATRDHRVVQLEYTKRGAPRPEKRLVHPLHLADPKRLWMLLAYDPAQRLVRRFRLRRIHKVKPTNRTFVPPAGFDAQKTLRESMGPFGGGEKTYDVRIALDAYAAFYAREEPWHESQQLTERGNGGAEITLRLNDLTDARIEVLRWGRHVEVIAPATLRDEVCEELQAAAAKYGPCAPTAPGASSEERGARSPE